LNQGLVLSVLEVLNISKILMSYIKDNYLKIYIMHQSI